ncbi:MAG: type II secretion system F family protein, partial [Acidobacteriota bacterium]
MTQYLCKVGTTSGDIEELTFDSNDEPSLRRDLVEKGYHVFWVRRSLGLGSLSPLLRTGRHRIKTQEFTVFNQELSALLKAGLPLLQSLNIMLERMRNPLFRRVLTDIREKVKSGISLSDAFGWHGDLFPRIYSASLLGGEKSGSLEQVIARYVSYLKLTEGTRKKVVAALVYPAFLFAALIAAAAVLLLHVVPKFAGFFDSFETDLPLLTVVLLTVANTVRANILLILTIVTAAVVVLYFWLQREGSRTVIDGAALRLPFFGPVMHLFATSQLARSLATLLSGGIPLVQSITIA